MSGTTPVANFTDQAPSRGGDWLTLGQKVVEVARYALMRKRTLTPEMFGAIGDGVADDQAAFVAMLAELKEGEHVILSPAVHYRHSDVITVPVKDTVWQQYGKMVATNTSRAAVQLGPNAEGTTWTGLWNETDWGTSTPVRGGTDTLTANLACWSTSRLTINGVISRLSRQCGVYLSTVKKSRLRDIDISRSQADSLHITHNCEDLDITGVNVTYSGDDAVAVVSYLRRGSGATDPLVDPCRRIRIRNIHARYSHARGCTILGGEDVVYTNIDVAYTRMAGCYMGSESGYQTHSAKNSWMRGGVVADVGYPIPASGNTADDPSADQSHLFMLSQQSTPVDNCGYEDIEVRGAGAGVYDFCRAVNSSGSSFTNCAVRRIRAQNGKERDAGIYLRMTNSGVSSDRLMDFRSPQNRVVTQAYYDALSSEAKNTPTWLWTVQG